MLSLSHAEITQSVVVIVVLICVGIKFVQAAKTGEQMEQRNKQL